MVDRWRSPSLAWCDQLHLNLLYRESVTHRNCKTIFVLPCEGGWLSKCDAIRKRPIDDWRLGCGVVLHGAVCEVTGLQSCTKPECRTQARKELDWLSDLHARLSVEAVCEHLGPLRAEAKNEDVTFSRRGLEGVSQDACSPGCYVRDCQAALRPVHECSFELICADAVVFVVTEIRKRAQKHFPVPDECLGLFSRHVPEQRRQRGT